VTEGASGRPPRFDSFTLPAATAARFLLLIITALAASAYVYAWLVGRLAAVSGAPALCADAARGAAGRVQPDRLIDWYGSCQRWANLREAGYIAAMVGLLVAATVTIYLVRPRWIARGTEPVSAVRQVSGPMDVFDAVVNELPDANRVRILVDTASLDGLGRAFGALGRYRILLSVNLLGAGERNRVAAHARLRTVLAHELAHIRNRDVDLTQLAYAIWWAFLAAAAVPFVVVAVRAPALLLSFSWRLAALLALLYAVRAGVLRTREHYADVYAVTRSSADLSLLASLAGEPGRTFAPNHPGRDVRAAVMANPRRLSALSAPAAAATGSLVGIAQPPAFFLARLLLPGNAQVAGWLVGLILGGLGAAALTGSVWRATLWALDHEEPRPGTWPSTLALTGGLLAGQLLTPDLPAIGTWRGILVGEPLLGIAIAAMLAAGLHAFFRWTVLCAGTWMPSSRVPVRPYRFGVGQAVVVAAVWLATWFQLVDLLSDGGLRWGVALLALLSGVLNPVLLISIAWACLYPLAGESFSGRRVPLTGVYAASAGTMLLYAAAVVPFYPQLRAALLRSQQPGIAAADALLPIVLILVVPALVTAVVGAVVLGLCAGGRGRTGYAVAATGCSMLISSIGLLVIALAHLTYAFPLVRRLDVLLTGLAGMATTSDAPRNPSLGLMFLLLYGGLLIVGIPAAMTGSGIRALLRPARPRPARRSWQVALLVTPFALVACGFGYLSVTEWVLPPQVSVPVSVDHAAIETILARAGTNTVPLGQACGHLYALYGRMEPAEAVTTGLADRLAAGAAAGLSADDETLNTMGEGTAEALRLSEVTRASSGISAMLQYCAAG
jgi:peptidase M48-like protein